MRGFALVAACFDFVVVILPRSTATLGCGISFGSTQQLAISLNSTQPRVAVLHVLARRDFGADLAALRE